jgi:hypothetical protein
LSIRNNSNKLNFKLNIHPLGPFLGLFIPENCWFLSFFCWGERGGQIKKLLGENAISVSFDMFNRENKFLPPEEKVHILGLFGHETSWKVFRLGATLVPGSCRTDIFVLIRAKPLKKTKTTLNSTAQNTFCIINLNLVFSVN